MDTIHLPARYDGLSQQDVQAHLRHCATKLKNMDRTEFLLCEAGVAIPAVKCVYRIKPTTLTLLARSGSIGREHLLSLSNQLEAEGFELKRTFTKQRKLMNRFVVSIAVDEPLYPLKAISVFRAIALQLNSPWPQIMSAGYGARSDGIWLPGQVTISVPILSASRKLGFAIGRAIRKLIT